MAPKNQLLIHGWTDNDNMCIYIYSFWCDIYIAYVNLILIFSNKTYKIQRFSHFMPIKVIPIGMPWFVPRSVGNPGNLWSVLLVQIHGRHQSIWILANTPSNMVMRELCWMLILIYLFYTGRWLNQPIWNICSSNLTISPVEKSCFFLKPRPNRVIYIYLDPPFFLEDSGMNV